MRVPTFLISLILLFTAKTCRSQIEGCDDSCTDDLGNTLCSESGDCQAACPIYREEEGETLLFRGINAIHVSDKDENSLFLMQSAVVEIFPQDTNDFKDIILRAGYQPEGIMTDYDSANGELFIDGEATVDMYQDIFNNVTILINNSEPDAVDRVVCLTVFDGDQASDPSCFVLKIIPDNDNVPMFSFNPTALNYIENGEELVLLQDLILTDIDHPNIFPMQMAQINVTGYCGSTDVITVDTAGTNIELVEGNGTGCITLRGSDTIEHYTEVLLSARYSNAADEPVDILINRTIVFSLFDGKNTGVFNFTISLEPVDDHITEILINPETFATTETAISEQVQLSEEVTLELRDNDTNVDVYVIEMMIEIIEPSDHEHLTVLRPDSTGYVEVIGNSTSKLIFRGEALLTVYQLLLDHVYYGLNPPNSEPPCPSMRRINITVTDNSWNTLTIQIMPVNNHAPDITLPEEVQYFENEVLNPLKGISITDEEYQCDINTLSLAQVTLTNRTETETIRFNTSFPWLTKDLTLCGSDYISAPNMAWDTDLYTHAAPLRYASCHLDSGDLQLIVVGVANISQYLELFESVEYSDTASEPPEIDRTLTVFINDSELGNVVIQTISVHQVNDNSPRIDTDGTEFLFYEQGGPVSVVGPLATIVDNDGRESHKRVSSFCVTIENPYPQDELVYGGILEIEISSSGSGDIFIDDEKSVCVSLSMCGGNINNVSCLHNQLSSVQYNSTEDEPTVVNRTVSLLLTAFDEEANLHPITSHVVVTVVPVNDHPHRILLTPSLKDSSDNDFYEGGDPVLTSPSARIMDEDKVDTILTGANISIALRTVNGDEVSIIGDELIVDTTLADSFGISITTPNPYTILLRGEASQDSYASILQTVEYVNTQDEPVLVGTTGETVIHYDVFDGKYTDTAIAYVTIHPVNDPPELPNVTVVYRETEPVFLFNSSIVIDDPDSNTLQWIRIEIVSQIDFLDNLTVTYETDNITTETMIRGDSAPYVGCYPTPNNVTIGTITFTGPATMKEFESAIRSVAFDNMCPGLSLDQRSIMVTLNDGVDSFTSWVYVDIVMKDDEPVCYFGQWPGITEGSSYTYTEEQPPISIISDFTFVDHDGGIMSYSDVYVNMSNVRNNGDELLMFDVDGCNVTVSNQTIDHNNGYYTVKYQLSDGSSYEEYNKVLQTMQYVNRNSEPATFLPRSIEISINYEAFTPCSVSVAIINTADHPKLVIQPDGHQFHYNEDSGFASVLSGTTVTITDDDSIFLYVVRFKILSTPTQYGSITDRLVLNTNIFTVQGNGSAELIVYGPKLYNLYPVFTPAFQNIQFTTDDQATNVTRYLSVEVEEYPLNEPGPSNSVLIPITIGQRNDHPYFSSPPLVSEEVLETFLPISISSPGLHPSYFVDKTVFGDPDLAYPYNPDIMGLAVYYIDNNGIGNWQYRAEVGDWVNITSVSRCYPLFLRETDQIRFLPSSESDDTGPVYFNYTLWDGTSVDVCNDTIPDETLSISMDTAMFVYTLDHDISPSDNVSVFNFTEGSSDFPYVFGSISLQTSIVSKASIEISCSGCVLPIDSTEEKIDSNLTSFQLNEVNGADLGIVTFSISSNNTSWNIQELQEFIRSLQYVNIQDEPEPVPRTVTLFISDGMGVTSGFAAIVNVIQIDDNNPVIHLSDFEIHEAEATNGALLFPNGNLITDPDYGFDLKSVYIEVHYSFGCHSFVTVVNYTALSLLPSEPPDSPLNNNIQILTFSGFASVEQYNEELSTLLYVSITEEPVICDEFYIFISAADSEDHLGQSDANIRIIPSNNNLPDVSQATTEYTFEENGPGIHPLQEIIVTDADIPDTPVISAEVTLLNQLDYGMEQIELPVSSIYDPMNEGVTVHTNINGTYLLINSTKGSINVNMLQENLRRVMYINTDADPATEQRVISVTVTDNLYPSNPTKTEPLLVYVNISSANNQPRVVLHQSPIMYVGQMSGAVSVTPNAVISDPDDNQLSGLIVTLSGNVTFTESEKLMFNQSLVPASVAMKYNTNQGGELITIVLNGTASIEDYTLLLRSLTYENTNTSTSVFGDRILKVQPIGLEMDLGIADMIEIAYASVNPSPVVDLNGSSEPGFDITLSFTEGDNEVLLCPQAIVADEGHNGEPSIVSYVLITLSPLIDIPYESLQLTMINNSELEIVWSEPNSTVMLRRTPFTTLDSFTQALRNLKYINTADEPSNGTRYITVVANDGSIDSITAMISVSIVTVNDAPLLSLNGHSTVNYVEGGDPVAIVINPSFSDPDSSIFTTLRIMGQKRFPGDVISSSYFTHNDTAKHYFDFHINLDTDGVVNLLKSLTYHSVAGEPAASSDDRVYCIAVKDQLDWSDPVCVTIDIVPRNDPHMFPESVYNRAVSEEDPGALVIQLNVTDSDFTSGTNAPGYLYDWNIVDGDDCHDDMLKDCSFYISENGSIFTSDIHPPNREERDEYSLVVVASDDEFNASVIVRISIIDINDNPPVLSIPGGSSLVVKENSDIGTVVGVVNITDADIGDNALSTIFLSNNGSGLFNINQQGQLMVAGNIDYETMDSPVYVSVSARNIAPPYFTAATLSVTMTIEDVDDNAPFVTLATGEVTFAEGKDFAVELDDVGVTINDPDSTNVTSELMNAKVKFLNPNPLEPSYPFTPTTNDNPSYCPLEDKEDKMTACGLSNPVVMPSSVQGFTAFGSLTATDDNTLIFSDDGNGFGYENVNIELMSDLSVLLWIWYIPSLDNNSSTIFVHVDRSSGETNGAISYGAVCHYGQHLEFLYYSDGEQKSVTFEGACSLLTGQWHHLGIVVHSLNGTQVNVFIDGVYYGGAAITQPEYFLNLYRVFIGARPGEGINMKDYFTGRIHSMVISPSIALEHRINCIIGCGVYLYSSILQPSVSYNYNYTARELVAEGLRGASVYEEFLNSLIFVIAFSEPRQLSYDLSYTVADNDYNPARLNISVSPSNDGDPVLSLNGPLGPNYAAVYVEEMGPVSIVNSSSLTLTDVDLLPYPYEIVATITNGMDDEILSVSGLPDGMTQSYSNYVLTVQGMFTIDAFETVLRTLVYENLADQPTGSSRTVSIVVNDNLEGPRFSNVAYSTVSLVFVNDPPVLVLSVTDLTYNEGDGPIPILTDAVINDNDNTILVSANISIKPISIGNEIISVNTTSTSITQHTYTTSINELVIVLSGEDTIENYQSVLETLTYYDNRANIHSGVRDISFVASDGVDVSNVETVVLMVFGINDRPILDINGPLPDNEFSVDFIEDFTTDVPIVADSLTLEDVDSDTFTAAYVWFVDRTDGDMETVLISQELGFVLNVVNSSLISIIPVSSNGSATDFINVLKSLRYVNNAEEPTPGDHLLQLTVSDGQDTSLPATITVSVIATPDPPMLDLDTDTDGTGYANTFTEDSGVGVNIASPTSTGITDNDAHEDIGISNITVVLKNPSVDGIQHEQVVSMNPNIAIPDPVESGSEIIYSIPNINGTSESAIAILTNLAYINNADEPAPHVRLIDISVADGTLVSNIARTVISIELVNDHTPMFEPLEVQNVFENQPNLTDVVVVKASDGDSGQAGEIMYSLVDAYPIQGLDDFEIDENIGTIFTVKELDRESIDQYVLTVEATDLGNPSRSAKLNVTVNVINVNDNPPMFDKEVYYASVSEAAPVGTTVATAVAVDNDHPLDIPSYNLVGTNEFFDVHENGDIVVNKSLDAESMMVHVITVVAQSASGTENDTAMFVITVLDVNEHMPMFTQSSYQGSVPENLVGGVVTTVIATDADASNDSILSYRFPSNSFYNDFDIDESTGVVTTARSLDRETQEAYTILVIVEDNDSIAPKTGTAAISVTVLDINDNKAVFTQNNYTIDIEEGHFGSLRVSATDMDFGENRTLVFDVQNKSVPFDTDGIIPAGLSTVDILIDLIDVSFETTKVITAEIIATDVGPDPMSSSAPLVINVRDVNDNYPLFVGTPYNAQAPENAPNYFIIDVNATDIDSGMNGEVRFELENYEQIFSIDELTGVVTTTVGLDFEEKCYYELSVIAYDLGITRLTSTTTVSITVTPLDDEPPAFNQSIYTGSVTEVANGEPFAGEMFVTQVFASDGETSVCEEINPGGSENPGNVAYTLLDHTSDFKINTTSGIITTLTNFDRESVPQYTLTVSASDSSGISINATVIVTITDINDNEPMFIKDMYTVTISSTIPTGVVFLQVTATDADVGDLSYSSVGDDSNLFFVDSSTGNVSLLALIEPESNLSVISFFITATDPGGLSAVVPVKVTIDYPPVLSLIPKSGVLTEPGTQIYLAQSLSITDSNPLLTLTMANVSVSSGPGTLSVVSTPNGVSLSGNGTQTLVFTGTVNITIYQSLLRTVLYTDPAEEPISINRMVTYQIHSEDETVSDVFNISVQLVNEWPPVVLLVNNTFDFIEDGDPVTLFDGLIITDQDSGMNVVTSAIVELLEAPNGFSEMLEVALSSELLLAPESTNQRLIIMGTAQLEVYTSVLRTITYSNSADNPNTNTRTVTIIVNDGSFNSTLVSVSISITSVNDRPIISLEPNSADRVLTYIEDQQEPLILAPQLTITDADSQLLTSATIILQDATSDEFLNIMSSVPSPLMEVVSTSQQISLVASSGLPIAIFETVLRSVTYSSNSEMQFPSAREVTFVVTDDGLLQSLQATARILFNTTDDRPVVDLNGPDEDGVDYTVYYTEDMDTPIAIVSNNATITDIDSEMVSNLTIELASVHSGDMFTFPVYDSLVKTETNEMIVYTGVQPLSVYTNLLKSFSYTNKMEEHSVADRRIVFQVFTLKSGNGISAGSNKAETIIKFNPVNDQPPVFTQDIYYGFIYENAPIGSSVGVVVVAMDTDIPINPDITYAIQGTNSNFQVDSLTGAVTTLQSLDAELQPLYITFTVTAEDSVDGVTQTATAIVNISIGDVNDNQPQFQQLEYFIDIPEDRPIGYIVYTVMANDSDRTAEHSTITYTLHGSNTAGSGSGMDVDDTPFTINNHSGQIMLTSGLDADMVDSYQLQVTASDGVHETDAIITVTVTGVNDNPPVFVNTPFSFAIEEDTPIGMAVYSVSAEDADADDVITYSIKDTNVFTIDQDNGSIYLALSLDYETESSVSFIVQATDSGSMSDTAIVNVTVLNVNNNEPEFGQASYAFSVYENSLFNTTEAIATDVDGDSLTYSLSSSDTCVNNFNIDPSSGTLSLTEPLDFEETKTCEFSIHASDGLFMSAAQINITVLDVNDNSPVFDQELYSADIPEILPVNSVVLTVSATDIDQGTNGEVTYSLASNSTTFSISSSTGEITLTAPLDYESVVSYNITVVAQDGGDPANSGTSEIRFTVTNRNDEEPVLFIAASNVSYTEESGSVNIAEGIMVMDPDMTSLSMARLTLQLTECPETSEVACTDGGSLNCFDICGEALMIDASTLEVDHLIDGLTLSVNLTGQQTVAQYESILSTLAYSNTISEPATDTRTVSITVNDGITDSNTLFISIAVQLVDDNCPVLSLAQDTLSFIEQSGIYPVGVEAGVSITDGDHPPHQVVTSAVITIGNLMDENESIELNSTELVLTQHHYSNSILLIVTGASDIATYNTLISTLTYSNDQSEPSPGMRIINITLQNGNESCSSSNQIEINVSLINDNPPILSLENTQTLNYTEESGSLPVGIDTGLRLMDADTTFDIVKAEIQLIGAQDNHEELSLSVSNTPSNVNITNIESSIVITGSASVAEYESFLRSLSYINIIPEPTPGIRTITITVNDGKYTSEVNITIDVQLIDDNQPELTCSTNDQTTVFIEGGTPVSIVPSLSLIDLDADHVFIGGSAEIINPQDGDQLSIETSSDSLNTNYNGDSIQIHGTSTANVYQELLRTLSYANTASEPSSSNRDVTITVYQPSINVTCTVSVSIDLTNDNTPLVDLNGPNTLDTNWTAQLSYNFVSPSQVAIASDSATITDADGFVQRLDIHLEPGREGDKLVINPEICEELVLSTTDCILNTEDMFVCTCDQQAPPLLVDNVTVSINDTLVSIMAQTNTVPITVMQLALRTLVMFEHSSSTSGSSYTSEITVTASDGVFTSQPALTTVLVLYSNNGPVVFIDNQEVSGEAVMSDGVSSVALSPNALVMDDMSNISQVMVHLTNPVHYSDEAIAVQLQSSNIAMSEASNDSYLILTGSDTSSQYTTVLRTLMFTYTRMTSLLGQQPNVSNRVITITAVDDYGAVGSQSVVTVTFDRSCTVWDDSTLRIPSELSVQDLGICTSVPQLHIRISDGVTSLLPLRDLQSVDTISLANMPNLQTLEGLENLGNFSELVIDDLPSLTSLDSLGANLSEQRKISIQNIVIRNCASLTNVTGLRIIEKVYNILQIQNCAKLYDLSGLNNVVSAGTLFLIQLPLIELKSFTSLFKLEELWVYNNFHLERITGLQNLRSLEELKIISNPSLRSIDGFSGLQYIEDSVLSVINPQLCYIGQNISDYDYWTSLGAQSVTIQDDVSSQCSNNRTCSDNPCLNDATCIPQPPNSYTCECTDQYFGSSCQYFNECNSDDPPCQNGGTCSVNVNVDILQQYQCSCPVGFTGFDCDVSLLD